MVSINVWTLPYGFKMAAQFQVLQPHATVFIMEKRVERKRTNKRFPLFLPPLLGRRPFQVTLSRPSLKSLDTVGKEELESQDRPRASMMHS